MDDDDEEESPRPPRRLARAAAPPRLVRAPRRQNVVVLKASCGAGPSTRAFEVVGVSTSSSRSSAAARRPRRRGRRHAGVTTVPALKRAAALHAKAAASRRWRRCRLRIWWRSAPHGGRRRRRAGRVRCCISAGQQRCRADATGKDRAPARAVLIRHRFAAMHCDGGGARRSQRYGALAWSSPARPTSLAGRGEVGSLWRPWPRPPGRHDARGARS